jgi:D-galactarolactone isomerase
LASEPALNHPSSARCGVPRHRPPPVACDCHMHFFAAHYPLAAKARHAERDASVADYRLLQKRLGLQRVVVVQPTAYGTDNRCTLDAIAELGLAVARGVAVVGTAATDAELAALHAGGIRGVRFRMLDKPELPWEMLEVMAARIAPLGWHIQFQMDGRQLHTEEARLAGLPCPLVIEHGGKFLEPVGLDHPGFRALARLLDNGRTWVKISGAYMTSKTGAPAYADVGVVQRALIKHAPERAVWATNWPHPLSTGGSLPDDAALLDRLFEWAGSRAVFERVLVANPAALYGFSR